MNKMYNDKDISLYRWIWKSYVRTALIPLAIVELIFICTYFGSNSWSGNKTVNFLKDQAKNQLNSIATQEANSINFQLSSITNSTVLLSKEMNNALSTPATLTSTDYTRLTYSKDGAYYTKENNVDDGTAIFYSGIVPIKENQQEKVAKILTKQKLMANIKNTSPLATSVYFNTFDSLNVIYPYFDVFSQYTPLVNIPSYNYYYEADTEHNPERGVKWTDIYLDPAGNGLITSAICPVYNNDFLEGVVGIDITINTIANQILKMDIPWDGYSLLIGKNGQILAYPSNCINDLNLSELSENNYDQMVLKNNFNSDELNLYHNKDFSPLINGITSNDAGFSNLTLNGEAKAISWSTIPNTGWKLLIVVPEKNIYSNVNTLKYQLIRVGIIAVLGLIFSYIIFFLILSKKVKSIGVTVANSFLAINCIVQRISDGEYTPKVPNLKIRELNDILIHLTKMGQHLGETNRNLLNTQLELRKKEIDLKALVNSINDIILEINSNGDITNLWSRAHHDLYKSYAQGLFNSIYDILDDDTSKIAIKTIRHVIDTRNTATMDFNLQSNSGLKCFQACISPRLNDENKVVVSSRDITEQKKLARSIIAAKEEAEKASKAKSEFLSSMSHELRTPLNAILGFSQILELDPESPLNDSQKQSVKEISKAGNHLLDLINEVLDLAKIESGKLSISMEPIPIGPVVEETVAIITPFANTHKIKIIMPDINYAEEFVYADHTRLKQVLLNLLSNAIKYNKEDGEVIFYYEKIADKFRFHVVDTGIGLSNSDINLIFKPFQRLNKINNTIEGTGIGLTVAKQLVELMDGKIFVSSKKNIGSHFWVELSCVELCRNKNFENPILPENEEVSFARDEIYKVLYVEDNPANLRLVECILNRINNIKMLSTTSGELCIDLALAHKPDIILLDINLPGIDGYEVLKRLKMHRETNDIPVIAVSAHAMSSDIQKSILLGFTDYITKPINIKNFIKKISDVLNSKK